VAFAVLVFMVGGAGVIVGVAVVVVARTPAVVSR